MIEKYYKYKLDYKDYVLIMKSGVFYETINNDAFIINKLLGYKIKKINNGFRVGFPINSLNIVLATLKAKQINYVIINDSIVDSYDFENDNKYVDYSFDENKIILNTIRINKITEFLNNNILNDNINNILEEIEKLI